MWANDPEMAKKWEKKEKMKKETKVKQLIKKMVREIMTESKRMNYKERDWKKINKIAKKKDVFIQTSYGDQFKWEEGGRDGVFATEEDGREIELSHDDIDVLMVEGKLTEMNEPWFEITYKDSRGRTKTDSMRAKNPKEAKKDFVNLMKGRGFKVLKVVKEGKLTEGSLKRFKVFVSGEKEPLILMGKNEKEVKQTAHMMIKNSSVKIRKVVKEAMSRRIAGKTIKIPQPGDFGNDMDKYFKALNKHMKEVEKLAKIQKKKGIKESGIMYRAGVKKYGKEGMKKIQSAAGKGADHAEIGAIKDKYDKKKKNEGKLDERMDKRKAATILKQIGGNRFIAMTGAKGFAFSDKYMSFKIGRNSKGINFVRIGHNAKDLYDMEFGFVSVKGIKVKKKVKDVYADMLGQIFKKHTGMNVSL